MKAPNTLVSIASIALLVATASVAAIGTVGCHKSSETEAREAALAAQKGQANAVAEAEDVVEAVARERRQLAAALTKEIDWVDHRIRTMTRDAESATGAVRDEKLRDVDTVRAWRDRLQADLDAVRAADPNADWSQLKAKIEADLDESRPVQVPRSWEKPYGI